jgi:hypothetical protein
MRECINPNTEYKVPMNVDSLTEQALIEGLCAAGRRRTPAIWMLQESFITAHSSCASNPRLR